MDSSQISNTAAFIAIKFYGLTQRDDLRSLFDDEVLSFYSRLVRSLPRPLRWYHGILRKHWARRFFTFWEELLLPGDLMHIVMRKWYLQKMIACARDKNYSQVVVLGAGFDHLGYVNARLGLNVLELDTPRMVHIKQDFLRRVMNQPSELTLQETMFETHALPRLLQASPLAADRKTMIIAEGFFDYFDRTSAALILDQINNYFEADHRLFSTIFSLHELPAFRAFIYRRSIRLGGEKLKLDMDKKSYCRFLGNHGLAIDQCISHQRMREDVLRPRNIELPVLPGFHLLETRRG